MEFSETIKEVRLKLLLTQKEFAKKMGVSFATVNRWENQKCEPSLRAKRKVLSLLKKINGDD